MVVFIGNKYFCSHNTIVNMFLLSGIKKNSNWTKKITPVIFTIDAN